MDDKFDPYHKWLGIPPNEQPANHYRLLGIVLFEDDPEVVESAADRQMAHVRTFQSGRYSAHSQEVLNVLSAAKVCLLKPAQKAEYDQGLRAKLEFEKPTSLPAAASTGPKPLQAQAAPSVVPARAVPMPSYATPQIAPVPVQHRPGLQGGSSGPMQIQTRDARSSGSRRQRSSGRLPIVAGLAALILVVAGWFVWSQSNRVDEQRESAERIAEKSNTKIVPAKADSTPPKAAKKTPPIQPQSQPTPPQAKVSVNVPLALPPAKPAAIEPVKPPVVPENPPTVVSVPAGNAPPPANVPFNDAQAKAHQAAWAKHAGTPVETTNSIGMKMALIPPGEFLMGSSEEQLAAVFQWPESRNLVNDQGRLRTHEQPQLRAALTHPYQIGATEVTIGQFRQFVEATRYVTDMERTLSQNPATTKKGTWREPSWPATDDLPVNFVSWSDCYAFCNWLSEREKLPLCYQREGNFWRSVSASGYRLPTEAEWEYACRAGNAGHFCFGDDVAELQIHAWFLRNASNKANAVGAKAPNAFGLYDMHGNLMESCQDVFARYDVKNPPHDPQGAISGAVRVSRGGGYNRLAYDCRSAARTSMPDRGNAINGFRVVRGIGANAPLVIEPPKTTPQVASIPPKQPATPVAAPGPDDGNVDLQALQWILSAGGSVYVRTPNGGQTFVRAGGNAPAPPFFVESFVLTRTLTNAGIANLQGLRHLRTATFSNVQITDEGLKQLQSIKSLQSLNCSSSQISDAGLLHLKDLSNLTFLSLFGSNVTDQGLTVLQTLTNLEELRLSRSRVTDAGLQHLAAFPKLRRLHLDDTAITDAGLAELGKLPNAWENLSLGGTKITGSGLKHLRPGLALTDVVLAATGVDDDGLKEVAAWENLNHLNLTKCTSITGAGLKHLQGLKKLRHIVLVETKITNEGLEHLQLMTALDTLNISSTDITDEGLKHVGQCANLRSLTMFGCKVSDVGLQHLQGLKKLTTVFVGKTAVTDAGKQSLKAALPACNFY